MMWTSPLVSRAHIASALCFALTVSAQTVPGASFFSGNGAPGAGAYQLVDDYEPSVFFNKFNYYSSYDPTYGHVQYVTEEVAVQNGFVTTPDNTAKISVDTTNVWPNGGPGRPAVRLQSDNTYTHGLFILDVKHMPQGCGTWPAYWLVGPNWPSNGEMDIIEGVNTGLSNSISMHSSPGCEINGADQTGQVETNNCDSNANGNSGCGSLLNNTRIPNNYGSGLNSIGGGVYATEWTSNYVKHWFFPRGSIPRDALAGTPNPDGWGTPAVNQQSGGGYTCDIDSHFNNMTIVINTDFCGAWAGWVYQSQFPDCPQNMSANSLDSCVDFVGNNPSYFVDAYWQINSIRVFQMPVGAQPSSSYTTSQSKAAGTATSNMVTMGNAASSTPGSSSYTGPVSSGTVSIPAASATPAICPGSNGTAWTNSNGQQYTIGCGSDYNGGAGSLSSSVFAATSFENCLEICDATTGCLAVGFIGGNGAGTCYLKATLGAFVYDGHTNSAVRIGGSASGISSSITASPLSSSSYAELTSSSLSNAVDVPSTSSSSMAAMSSTMSMTPSASSTGSTAGQCQNATQISDASGVQYTLYCGYDTSGGAYASQNYYSGDYTQCMTFCNETSDCAAWTWAPGSTVGGACYLKSGTPSPMQAVGANAAAYVAGIQVSPSAGISSRNQAQSTSSIPPASSPSNIQTSTSSLSSQTTMPSSSSLDDGSGAATTSMAASMSSSQMGGSTSSSSSQAATSTVCLNNAFTTDKNGVKYTLYCDSDTSQGAFANQVYSSGDFTQCMVYCDATTGCGAWTWSPGSTTGGVCYLKAPGSTPVGASAGMVAGVMVTAASSTSSAAGIPTGVAVVSGGMSGSGNSSFTSTSSSASASVSALCPSVNNTQLTDTIGNQYTIFCGKDTSGGSFANQIFAAGDFTQCIDACDGQNGCTAWTWSAYTGPGETGGVCYFKSGTQTPTSGNSALVGGIIYITVPSPSSRVASSSSVRPSSSSSSSSASASMAGVSSRGSLSSTAGNGASTAIASTGAGYDYSSSVPGYSTGQIVASTAMIGTSYGYSSVAQSSSRYSTGQPELGSSIAVSMTSMPALMVSNSSSSSPLPTCGSGSPSGTACQDSYGNSFNVTYGRQYVGTVSQRSTQPDIDACLLQCDTTPSCVAANFQDGTCALLSEVTGTISIPFMNGTNVAAATRPPNVGTIYTTPQAAPATTTSMQNASPSVVATSASYVPTPACGSIFYAPDGAAYNIRCQTDNSAATYNVISVSSGGFGVCFGACDTDGTCAGFTYTGGDSGTCSLKSSIGTYSAAPANILAAFKIVASGSNPAVSGPVTVTGTYESFAMPTTAGGAYTVTYTYDYTMTSNNGSAGAVSTNTAMTYGSAIYNAPPCPTSASSLCATSNQQTICSDSQGAAYDITCGLAYQGTIMNEASSSAAMLKRQTFEPDYQQCTNLCDSTSSCIAFNYIGTDCTLFSQVTGTNPVPGAIAATQLAPPGTVSQGSNPVGYQSGSQTVAITPTSTMAGGGGIVNTTQPSTTISTPPIGGSLTPGQSNSSPITTPSGSGPGSGSGSGSGAPGSGGVSNNFSSSSQGAGSPETCKTISGTGTMTVFTTHTITGCGTSSICPKPGYIIGSGATQSGQIVVTTTDSRGSKIMYTQIPTGSAGKYS